MVSKTKRDMLELYNRGLELYKRMNFKEALASFQKALELEPSDGPTKLYISRCEELCKNPPPADWDGVFTMTTK
ncbi:MAG: tetratricopeptide repeat protein [Spirochaetes bacterium]|nr:tetratricopeptide repeat protein [Spirochaetota bacterium]